MFAPASCCVPRGSLAMPEGFHPCRCSALATQDFVRRSDVQLVLQSLMVGTASWPTAGGAGRADPPTPRRPPNRPASRTLARALARPLRRRPRQPRCARPMLPPPRTSRPAKPLPLLRCRTSHLLRCAPVRLMLGLVEWLPATPYSRVRFGHKPPCCLLQLCSRSRKGLLRRVPLACERCTGKQHPRMPLLDMQSEH